MFDTQLTLIGNALTTPEWRRTTHTKTLVAHFKVASHSRRYDRTTGRWVDGDSLRVRVTCWRRLAEGVCASILSGDPVVVTGRMYTRDWTADDGTHRVGYELEATAVGHDLTRGRSRFTKRKPNPTTAVEDDGDVDRINGEPTEAVDPRTAVRLVNQRPGDVTDERYSDEDEPFTTEDGAEFDPEEEALAILRSAGLDTELVAAPVRPGDPDDDEDADDEDDEDAASDNDDEAAVTRSGRTRRSRRQPVAA